VYTVPVYDMIEHVMLRHKININWPLRFGYRTCYVIAITFVAITLVRVDAAFPSYLLHGGF